MNADVDDKGDRAIVLGSVRNVEALGDADALVERELGYLRVGKKSELAAQLSREERPLPIAHPIRDLVRAEDDLIGVGIPEAAHGTLGRRRCEGLEVSEG